MGKVALIGKIVPKNIDVSCEIIRVAPAAATGRDRETLEKARLNESSSAGLISLPVKCSLKVWVPQILPPREYVVKIRKLAVCQPGNFCRRTTRQICWKEKTKNHIVCCVLSF